MDSSTRPRRRHPARGARKNTAVFSAAAFIGLGAGIAVQQSAVGTANPITTVPVTTAPTTSVAPVPAQEYDDDAPITATPTTATPAPTPVARQRVAPPQAKTGGS